MNIQDFLKNKQLSDKEFVTNNISNLESSRQSIWQGLKLEHMSSILTSMKLDPHTRHRYWPDGIRLKEDHPNYEKSFWMYGWSTTRKKEFAMNWGDVVFELDHSKISQNFEIQPISWNNLFKHVKDIKKHEFEEFIVAHRMAKSLDDLKQEEYDRDVEYDRLYNEIYNEKDPVKKMELQKAFDEQPETPSWIQEWNRPKGKSIDLNSCLKGIYVDSARLKDSNQSRLKIVVEHPKFKGFYEAPRQKEKNKLKNSF